jgi:hypothetical protein
VTDWAETVQPAVNTPPKAPAYQMVQRAVIQIAVYDAVMAIEGGFEPFAGSINSSPEPADVGVAVAAAIDHALSVRDAARFFAMVYTAGGGRQHRRL